MDQTNFSIAIDGPSGAGKSTLAKLMAKELGIEYVDTGAMYRALAYRISESGMEPKEGPELKKLLEETSIDFSDGKIFLDGLDVSDRIRTQEISKLASDISAFGSVREKLASEQRELGKKKSVIMDGRDIGTVVLRDIAKLKLYINASPEERAKRRRLELSKKGDERSLEQVLKEINERDYNDSHRAISPLRKAEDAIELDTTAMDIDTVLKESLRLVNERRKEC